MGTSLPLGHSAPSQQANAHGDHRKRVRNRNKADRRNHLRRASVLGYNLTMIEKGSITFERVNHGTSQDRYRYRQHSR